MPLRLLCVVVAAVVLTTGCADRSLPKNPYDHALMNERSEAVPVPDRGEAAQIVVGLETMGFFCAQVRANDTSAQVWCRAEADTDTPTDTETAAVFNMITTREGVVEYADVTAPAVNSRDPSQRLREVLAASFWAVWPDDASKLDKAITDIQIGPGMFPSDPHPPQRERLNTNTARYIVAEGGTGLEFSLTTSAVQDRSWPRTGDGYATTTTDAEPGLLRGGFKCWEPGQSLCRRGGNGSNQQIRFTTAGDHSLPDDPHQILTADMFVPGTSEPDDSGTLTAVGFPDGLPFLTSRTRGPVQQQIVNSRRSGESFTGIVAGAVVIIDAPHDRPPSLDGPCPVDVTIGVEPLHITYPD